MKENKRAEATGGNDSNRTIVIQHRHSGLMGRKGSRGENIRIPALVTLTKNEGFTAIWLQRTRLF
jgi:hypothetical protein